MRVVTFDEYHLAARTTAAYPWPVLYPTLGLCGEAGEVAEKVKKAVRDQGGRFDNATKDAVKAELGDVLWYVAALSHDLGFSLGEVAAANLEKLESRRARGAIHGSGDDR